MSTDEKPHPSTPVVTPVTSAPNARMVPAVDQYGHPACAFGGTVVAFVTHTTHDRENTYGGNTVYVPRHRLFALVAASDNERIAELERQAIDADQDHQKARTALWDEGRKIEALDKKLAEANARIGDLDKHLTIEKDRFASSQESVRASATSLRKLEGDLAKVKRHIGEKAFAEALAEKAKS